MTVVEEEKDMEMEEDEPGMEIDEDNEFSWD